MTWNSFFHSQFSTFSLCPGCDQHRPLENPTADKHVHVFIIFLPGDFKPHGGRFVRTNGMETNSVYHGWIYYITLLCNYVMYSLLNLSRRWISSRKWADELIKQPTCEFNINTRRVADSFVWMIKPAAFISPVSCLMLDACLHLHVA